MKRGKQKNNTSECKHWTQRFPAWDFPSVGVRKRERAVINYKVESEVFAFGGNRGNCRVRWIFITRFTAGRTAALPSLSFTGLLSVFTCRSVEQTGSTPPPPHHSDSPVDVPKIKKMSAHSWPSWEWKLAFRIFKKEKHFKGLESERVCLFSAERM